jgi:O-antigen/teichoic acid export membrane protein
VHWRNQDLPPGKKLSLKSSQALYYYALPVILAEVSQILINNSDILIVKRFFQAEPAGLYAALALIGRIVFFATWSLVNALFPIVAQRQERDESHRHLLWLACGLVTGVAGIILLTTVFFSEQIVEILFGDAYLSIAPLLWRYAVATSLYALANVVISYNLSLGNSGGTVFAFGAGVAQVFSLWLFHESLLQVVDIQILIMSILFGLLLGWDYWANFRNQINKRE